MAQYWVVALWEPGYASGGQADEQVKLHLRKWVGGEHMLARSAPFVQVAGALM